jgi:hypothetical protein
VTVVSFDWSLKWDYFHTKDFHGDLLNILQYFTFMWLCIVTNFFVIKPTRCTNLTNLFWHETTCFRQFVCPSSGVYSLYIQQWYTSYGFVDSFRAGPGWSSVLVLLKSRLQTCMAYTNLTNLFWHETLHVSDGSSVHHQEFYSLYTHQEFIHCTLIRSLFTVHSVMVYVIQLGPPRKLSTNLYDIYNCWMYSE